MRLATPFIKLPLRLDAARLRAEIAQIPGSEWRPHPQGNPGNSALPLIAHKGNPLDDGVAGPMRPTPHLARCLYVQQVLAALDVPLGRTRLMKLDAGAEATAHVDVSYYWQQRVRVHVPVVTFPEVEFICGDASTHMAEGECWIFDTWRMHNVINPTNHERIHLVADTVGSETFWQLTATEGPTREVPLVPFRRPALRFESSNFPVVMSPWEIESLWDGWLADAHAGPSDQGVIDKLGAAFQPLIRDWRSVWAEYGDASAGWHRYVALIARATGIARTFAGTITLPNGVDFAQVMENGLIPALHSPALAQVGATTVRSPEPAPARPVPLPAAAAIPSRSTLLRFERPLVILAAPRSGSSLIFETLAHSPDLYTVGGESHQQFESIPALRPEARGYDSNRLDRRDAAPGVLAALRQGFAENLRNRDGRPPPATAGAVRLLEKTPKNALRVPLLDALFPDALYVFLYREPQENASSLIEGWESGRFVMYPNLPDWPGPSWSFLLVPGWRNLAHQSLAAIAAAQWQRTLGVLLDDLGRVPPTRVHALTYRDFLADPVGNIAQICAFAGIGWDRKIPAALPLSRHTVTPPHPEKWRRHEAAIAPYLPALRATDERARAFVSSLRARRPEPAPINT
jgi:Sulfotransferase family/Aspartyl/Asparaginyl beta-hydroxylase